MLYKLVRPEAQHSVAERTRADQDHPEQSSQAICQSKNNPKVIEAKGKEDNAAPQKRFCKK